MELQSTLNGLGYGDVYHVDLINAKNKHQQELPLLPRVCLKIPFCYSVVQGGSAFGKTLYNGSVKVTQVPQCSLLLIRMPYSGP